MLCRVTVADYYENDTKCIDLLGKQDEKYEKVKERHKFVPLCLRKPTHI
jgi:hypothetical protein